MKGQLYLTCSINCTTQKRHFNGITKVNFKAISKFKKVKFSCEDYTIVMNEKKKRKENRRGYLTLHYPQSLYLHWNCIHIQASPVKNKYLTYVLLKIMLKFAEITSITKSLWKESRKESKCNGKISPVKCIFLHLC